MNLKLNLHPLTGENMERKHIALLLSLLVALGGLTLLPWGWSQGEGDEEWSGGAFPRRHLCCRWRMILFILTHGESTTLEGRLILVEGRILVLEAGGMETYVVLPHRWLVDGEVLTVEELFDGDPLGPGDTLTIRALRLTHVGENHTVEFYAAYEVDGGGVEARALTPFNIRPS